MHDSIVSLKARSEGWCLIVLTYRLYLGGMHAPRQDARQEEQPTVYKRLLADKLLLRDGPDGSAWQQHACSPSFRVEWCAACNSLFASRSHRL